MHYQDYSPIIFKYGHDVLIVLNQNRCRKHTQHVTIYDWFKIFIQNSRLQFRFLLNDKITGRDIPNKEHWKRTCLNLFYQHGKSQSGLLVHIFPGHLKTRVLDWYN